MYCTVRFHNNTEKSAATIHLHLERRGAIGSFVIHELAEKLAGGRLDRISSAESPLRSDRLGNSPTSGKAPQVHPIFSQLTEDCRSWNIPVLFIRTQEKKQQHSCGVAGFINAACCSSLRSFCNLMFAEI